MLYQVNKTTSLQPGLPCIQRTRKAQGLASLRSIAGPPYTHHFSVNGEEQRQIGKNEEKSYTRLGKQAGRCD